MTKSVFLNGYAWTIVFFLVQHKNTFESFDFVVNSFNLSDIDRLIKIDQDAVTMRLHGICHFDKFGD